MHLDTHSKDGMMCFKNFVSIAIVTLFGSNMLVTLVSLGNKFVQFCGGQFS